MSEKLARKFHEAYERLAPAYGYETRKETRVFCPESQNGRLMIAVCAEVVTGLEAEVERLRDLCEYANDHIMSYHLGDEDYVLTGDSVEDAKQVWRDAYIWRRDYEALQQSSDAAGGGDE